MGAVLRPLTVGLCSLLVIPLVLATALNAAVQDEPAIVFEFSPARSSYEPGKDFIMVFTVTNTLPEQFDPSTHEPVNTVKFLNISVHFSWMAPNVYVWENLTATSSWLAHAEMEEYTLNLSVPSNATEMTHSYFFSGTYLRHTPWGDIESNWGPSLTYHDFVVAVGGGPQGEVDYVPYVAVIALVLAVGSIGAVAYSRKSRVERNRKLRAISAEESLGIAQAPAAAGYPVIHAAPGERFPIERGFIYLVKEQRPNISFAMFNEAVKHGAKGMLVVREHPNRLKQVHEFDARKILWLTRRVGEDHIDPTELSLLTLHISKFVESTPKSVVLLEGLEYLITQNDFETVLRFVNHLHDFVLAHDCAVVIVIDPRVLATRELALLERSSRIVEPGEYSVVKPDRLSEELEA